MVLVGVYGCFYVFAESPVLKVLVALFTAVHRALKVRVVILYWASDNSPQVGSLLVFPPDQVQEYFSLLRVIESLESHRLCFLICERT